MESGGPTEVSSAVELAVGLACLAAGVAMARSRARSMLGVAGVAIAVAGAVAVVHAAIAWI